MKPDLVLYYFTDSNHTKYYLLVNPKKLLRTPHTMSLEELFSSPVTVTMQHSTVSKNYTKLCEMYSIEQQLKQAKPELFL